MHLHPLAATTHTVEMDQLAQLNEGLKGRPPGEAITASDLGLSGMRPISTDARRSRPLAARAVLERLSYEGPPEYPYIHAHFRTPELETTVVELHTPALRRLSQMLHVQALWGVGSGQNPLLAPIWH
ncbi:hypothetical protein GCM10009841_23410 [Microlunatus panaciterrae]|uniref:Uncharacterized protein n=1 Tax=Microlunatus panaciterrae TaxID=400768 RepID=A0ABS2RE53_9ACTN|nr:hypothetical protein [Microlunatus panaciterrae]MBM7797222.1 hypothetical protein [Microlunatus panaciterrae]